MPVHLLPPSPVKEKDEEEEEEEEEPVATADDNKDDEYNVNDDEDKKMPAVITPGALSLAATPTLYVPVVAVCHHSHLVVRDPGLVVVGLALSPA